VQMPGKSGSCPKVGMEPERLCRKGVVEQMGFKSGVKG